MLKKKTIKREKENNDTWNKEKQNENKKQQDSNFLPNHVNINVNGLNAPIKRQNQQVGFEKIEKQNLLICCL